MKPLTLFTAALCLAVSTAGAADGSTPQSLATFTVTAGGTQVGGSVDGQLEAVREATLSAQVQGAVTSIAVRPGDQVKAGQELVRIDARAAQQNAAASAAQVDAARAAQQVATKEYERQRQLFQKQYISQAALDRAEAQWRATQSQVQALQAQAAAAATQSGFYVIKAPFSGVIGDVPATVGDMALPGKPLVSIYDPLALRVTAHIGQQQAVALRNAATDWQVEIPALGAARIAIPADKVQVLPTVDAQSHTVQVRLELPTTLTGAAPGMFARWWLGGDSAPVATSGTATAASPLLVPAKAVVRRAELAGLYVLDANNRPLLRQVRLGRPAGDMVEVLSGVRPGDRVVTQPQAAAKVR